VVHIVVFVMGSAISPLFPTMRFSAGDRRVDGRAGVGTSEELPAPSPPIVSSARPDSIRASFRQTGLDPSRPEAAPAARRWLEKLDAGITNVARGACYPPGGEGGGDPGASLDQRRARKARASLPPVAPEKSAASGSSWRAGGTRARVRQTGVGFGKETRGVDDVRWGRRHRR